MTIRSLYARVALTFAILLLIFGTVLSLLNYHAAKTHQLETLQRVNLELAEHIVQQLHYGYDTVQKTSIDTLFNHLMAVNPNIEVYLLNASGKILQVSPDVGIPVRTHIDLAPVNALMHTSKLPILGENPRQAHGGEIFSAAPIRNSDNKITGYIYIILLNNTYRSMVNSEWRHYILRSAAWITASSLLVALAVGLIAFAMITRRLQHVTRQVESFAKSTKSPRTDDSAYKHIENAGTGDEIDRLMAAFTAMRLRLQTYVAELQHQDKLRCELIANVSHDLRTPLTSMQGYLETLSRMDPGSNTEEQRQYLHVAVRQSQKVSRLAQQLFELARLDYKETTPQKEIFFD